MAGGVERSSASLPPASGEATTDCKPPQDGREGHVPLPLSREATNHRPHRDHTSTALSTFYSSGGNGGKRDSATLRAVEDYTSKYKGEQVEVALFGGDYHEGVLTAYCAVDEVAHIELNGHILIPLQNIASLHCTSRCDAPEPDWPPRGFAEDERDS